MGTPRELAEFPTVEITATIPLKITLKDIVERWGQIDPPDEWYNDEDEFIATKADIYKWLTEGKGRENLVEYALDYLSDDGLDALDDRTQLDDTSNWAIRIPEFGWTIPGK